jgi:hypothetical protein
MTSIRSDGLQKDLVSTPSHQDPDTPDRVLEYALGFWRSVILLSADELGVFAALATGPRAAEVLGSQLGLRQDVVEDYLGGLVTLGLVARSEGQYRITREASLYLVPANPSYLGGWLAMARAAMRAMSDLPYQLRAISAPAQEHPTLAFRMWEDIASILRESFPYDGA